MVYYWLHYFASDISDCNLTHLIGLELAKLADLPETVLEKSTEIAYKLEARQTQGTLDDALQM